MSEHTIGARIAWDTMFGNTMVGTVSFLGFSQYYVERMDGGQCRVDKAKCRIATHEDTEACAKMFANIGK